jgi:serine/threonine-protein kinase
MLLAHHVASPAEIAVVFRMIPRTALGPLLIWASYLALEPWVRRYWPQSLIVWSRALAGRWRDPVLGRDVLIGMTAGSGIMIGAVLFKLVTISAGSAAPMVRGLTDLRLHLGSILDATGAAVFLALAGFLILFFARVLVKNQWLATVVPAGFLAAMAAESGQPVLSFAVNFVIFGAVTVVLMRLGLLVAVAALFTIMIFNGITTSNFSAWYGQGSFLSVLVLIALALWAFRTSLGGQSIWGRALSSPT